MMPIGKMTPGMIDLLTTEVTDSISAPGERRGRQEEALILADQHAGDVRADQADEADRADEGHRNGGQQADDQHRLQPQAADVDAEARAPCPRRAAAPSAPRRGAQKSGSISDKHHRW